jgi:hypothetical protein
VLRIAHEYWETALAGTHWEMGEYQRATARYKDHLLPTLGHAVGLLLDEEHNVAKGLWEQNFARVPNAKLKQTLATAHTLTQPATRSYLNFSKPITRPLRAF